MMRRTSIGNEAFLLRLSWGNADAAGFSGRLAIRPPPVSPALWRGDGRWILRSNAGDGWPWGDFMTATVDEQTTVTVRGACPHDCPDTCAMLVSVRGGRAVEVRGDPEHPFTRGGLC
ncbi:MAG: hypothetical protein ACRDOE_23105, partial [Streptosporangiaceae bacterium]